MVTSRISSVHFQKLWEPTSLRADAAASFSIAYTDGAADAGAGAADYTFSGMDIGAADATRDVYVALGYVLPSDSVASVTVGGVSATELIQEETDAENSAIWYAAVPTGATGDVVIGRAGTGTFSAISIALYRVLNGTAGNTATENQGGTTMTLDVNATSSDYVIALVQSRNGSSWAGNWSADFTENISHDANSNEWFSSAHSASTVGGGTPDAFSVTCASAGAGDSGCIVVITPD